MRSLRDHPHIQGVLLLIVLWGSVVAAFPLVRSAFRFEDEPARAPAVVTVVPRSPRGVPSVLDLLGPSAEP
ncbi:MAG TPA: hypothetical protein VF183_05700 [Acidimicrobiales bacterium]